MLLTCARSATALPLPTPRFPVPRPCRTAQLESGRRQAWPSCPIPKRRKRWQNLAMIRDANLIFAAMRFQALRVLPGKRDRQNYLKFVIQSSEHRSVSKHVRNYHISAHPKANAREYLRSSAIDSPCLQSGSSTGVTKPQLLLET